MVGADVDAHDGQSVRGVAVSQSTGSVLGVDARRGGWACALVEVAGGGCEPQAPVRWLSPAALADVLALPVDAVGIDIPIGLPEHGRRACDVAAKALLGAAHARVFLTPPRAVLDAPDHASANALHRRLVDGKGMSVQTWHVLAKVAEADAALADAAPAGADVHRRVVEVHPELSFAALAGAPLVGKRTATGRAARIAAVRRWLPDLDEDTVPPGDDHLDALAAAWSAARWWAGTATVLPEGVEPRDALGVPQRIVI